jgi:tRNA 2-thiouridine synthesizing protein D
VNRNRISAFYYKTSQINTTQESAAFKMKFAIQVNTSPYQSNAGHTAFKFIHAALAQGHVVFRVFFYHDGIYQAFKYATPPDDELQFISQWSALAKCHHIDLVVCISAAQRRGLLCFDEAERQGKMDDDLAPGFRISGLGQLVDAVVQADRFIVF